MEITFDINGETVVAVPEGRVDGDTSDELEERFVEAAPNGGVALMDMGEVSYISSAGLRAMMLISNRTLAKDCRFAVCNLQEVVHHVFDVSGFFQLMSIYGTRDAALEALREPRGR